MKSIIFVTVTGLISTVASAQQTPQNILLPPTAVQTVINGYLHPSKVEPGDVFQAIQEIQQAAQQDMAREALKNAKPPQPAQKH